MYSRCSTSKIATYKNYISTFQEVTWFSLWLGLPSEASSTSETGALVGQETCLDRIPEEHLIHFRWRLNASFESGKKPLVGPKDRCWFEERECKWRWYQEQRHHHHHHCNPRRASTCEQEVRRYPQKRQRKWRPAEMKAAAVPMVESSEVKEPLYLFR